MASKNSTTKTFVDAYRKKPEEVAGELTVDAEEGLSNEEAEKRLRQYGRNKLEESEGRSIWEIIFAQINNPVIYLLFAASILAFIFGDIPEAIAILVVLIVNTIIGFWMEYQAQKSMDAIKEMDKIRARVLRNGQEEEIDAEEVVPGDIVLVEAGDLVPADCRILEEIELKADESPLTGESVPVEKTVEALDGELQIADRTNILYKGTAITSGTGKAVVFATAMNTEVGNISSMVQEQEDKRTPLNQKLNNLTKTLIWVILGMAAAYFVFGWLAGKELYQLVQTSIAWSIAAIPEGLPIVASIALARGMFRLAKKNVLVKKLSAVETLGETTVIFTDKTGTLTKNELTVNSLYLPEVDLVKIDWHKGEKPETEGLDDPHKNANFSHIFKISVLANEATLEEETDEATAANDRERSEKDIRSRVPTPDDDEEATPGDSSPETSKDPVSEITKGTGDPLEIALLSFAQQLDSDIYEDHKKLERELHDPFDSETMVMGTISKEAEGHYVAGKGSTEAILSRSKKIQV
ncbi:MAG TPA: HAD-IC family P-type ATPase, partial [Gillisia sp.]|nr:HAD-IC family P-type ATPase [Gillisia sp.]